MGGHKKEREAQEDAREKRAAGFWTAAALLVTVVPLGLSYRGVTVNQAAAAICAVATFGILAFIAWTSPWTYELSRRWRLLIAMGVAVIVGGTWVYTAQELVSVSPDETFIAHNGQASATTAVYVIDNRSVPLYSVAVKIGAMTPWTSANNISVDVTRDPTIPSLLFGLSVLYPDVWMFDCEENDGSQSVGVVFYALGPQQQRVLTVSGNDTRQIIARATYIRSNTKPDVLMNNDTGPVDRRWAGAAWTAPFACKRMSNIRVRTGDKEKDDSK